MSSISCKFYSLGQCTKGSKCPFVHDDSGICLYYQTGNCRFGNKCALKHIKLNKKSATKTIKHVRSVTRSVCQSNDSSISRETSVQVKYADMAKTNAVSNLSVQESKIDSNAEYNGEIHILPTEPFVPIDDRTPLCPFKDYCRFGKDCKYKHGLECHLCNRKVLHPQGSIEEYQGIFIF